MGTQGSTQTWTKSSGFPPPRFLRISRIEKEKMHQMLALQDLISSPLFRELLRSKGFFWIATSNDVIGAWQQAGNVLRIVAEMPWMCLMPDDVLDSANKELVKQDMTMPNGEEYEFKDRRQEIVFIGHRMKQDVIQELLDSCLLTDEEMALGPDGWMEKFEEFDTIKLALPEDDGDEEDEDGEGEGGEDEEGEEGR